MIPTPAENSNALAAAVAQLYSVFSRYPLRDEIYGDVKPEDQARLRNHPLRELTSDDLAKYVGKALTTWGDLDDFKHFLPRILELLAGDPPGWTDAAIITFRLSFGEWQTWPAVEQRAVKEYFTQYWRVGLDRLPWIPQTGDRLSAIMRVEDDLQPYLAYWEQACHESEMAAANLGCFLLDTSGELARQGTFSVFLEQRPQQNRQVAEWLTQRAIMEFIPTVIATFNRAHGIEDGDMKVQEAADLLAQ